MKKLLCLFVCFLVQMAGFSFAEQQQLVALQKQFTELTDILEKSPKPKVSEKPAVIPAPKPEVSTAPVKLTKEDYVKYLDAKIMELEHASTSGQSSEELAMLKGIREDVRKGISLQKAVAEEIPEAPAIIPEAPGIPAAPELPSGVPAAPPVPAMEMGSKKPATTTKQQVQKAQTPRDEVMKAIKEGAFKLKKAGLTPQAVVQKAEAPQKDALMQAIRGGVKLKRAKSVLPVVKPEATSDLEKILAQRRQQITGREKEESGKKESEEDESTWETA